MSDLELLFVVLGALYAWECAWWVPRDAVVFRTWLGRRWGIAHPGSLLGNQRGGLVFAPPLPPLGTVLAGTPSPISLSPDAVLVFAPGGADPGARAPQTGECLAWETVRAVDASGRKLRVDGRLLLKAASPTLAAHLAAELQRLAQLPQSGRAAAIETIIGGSLDTEAVRRRWEEFRRHSAGLRPLVNALAVFVFVAAPFLIWELSLSRCWPWLVAGVLGLTTAIAWRFRRAHQRLYPAAADERLTHFLTVLLAPATSMRALDILSRPLLETFHPLAVARVFCSDTQFRSFAARTWRELSYPPSGLPGGARADALEAQFRARLKAAVENLVRQSGITPETLAAPPLPADPACRSYCPRCLAQFTLSEGLCADCRQPLRPVAQTGQAPAARG